MDDWGNVKSISRHFCHHHLQGVKSRQHWLSLTWIITETELERSMGCLGVQIGWGPGGGCPQKLKTLLPTEASQWWRFTVLILSRYKIIGAGPCHTLLFHLNPFPVKTVPSREGLERWPSLNHHHLLTPSIWVPLTGTTETTLAKKRGKVKPHIQENTEEWMEMRENTHKVFHLKKCVSKFFTSSDREP